MANEANKMCAYMKKGNQLVTRLSESPELKRQLNPEKSLGCYDQHIA
jgi:hypothetical protein